jgi:signal transduction histidine kinase
MLTQPSPEIGIEQPPPGGTGLGLSVVRRLVADLDGSLAVRPAPGEGTTVTIELPATVPGATA